MEKIELKLTGPWDEVKEYLKEANTDLTNEDLDYQPGQENQLLQRLAKKLNKTEEQVKDLIESVSYSKGIAG